MDSLPSETSGKPQLFLSCVHGSRLDFVNRIRLDFIHSERLGFLNGNLKPFKCTVMDLSGLIFISYFVFSAYHAFFLILVLISICYTCT